MILKTIVNSKPLLLNRLFFSYTKQLEKDSDILSYIDTQFDIAIQHMKEIKYSHLPLEWFELLKKCDSRIKMNLMIPRDNGTRLMVEAYRSHHHYYRTPCAGGVIITPEVNGRETEALAVYGTIKSACHDIPFGGAKGAIKINKELLSEEEMKRLCVSYISQLVKKQYIGSSSDVIGPSMGATEREINFMYHAYKTLKEHEDLNFASAIVGKNARYGGIDGFVESSGLGVSAGLKFFLKSNEFCNYFNIPIGINGKTVVIQGYGQLGSWAHRFLEESGFRVIGVIEKNSGVFHDEGLNYNRLNTYWKLNKTFEGIDRYKVFKEFDAVKLLSKECDILLLAATGGVINPINVRQVKARIVVEGADAAVTQLAQEYLDSVHVPILPDVLINGGKIIAFYLEWLKGKDYQKADRFINSIEKTEYDHLRELGININKLLVNVKRRERSSVKITIEDMMIQSCRDILKYTLKYKVRLKVSAYVIAIKKILQNYHELGLIF